MFQTVYQSSGYTSQNLSDYPLSGKTISEIVKYIVFEMNPFGKETEIRGFISDKLDFIPDNSNPFFFDFQMILWNIWDNACRNSGRKFKKVWVCFDEKDNEIIISVKNKGKLPDKFIKYMENSLMAYPTSKKSYKPRRGLQIIKELCFKHNLLMKYTPLVENNMNYTKAIIKMKL